MKRIWIAYKNCFFLLDNKKRYLINQIEKIILSLINILSVYYFSLVISNIFNYDSDSFFQNVFINIILTVIRVLLSIHSSKLEISIKKNTNVSIKKKIAEEIFSLPPYIESTYPKGKIVNIVLSDSLTPSNFLYFINNYVIQFFTTIMTGYIMLRLSWKLSICSVLIFPIVNLINIHYGKKIKSGKIVIAEKNDSYIEFLKQILSCNIDIVINGLQKTIIEENTKKMEEIKNQDLQFDMLQTIVKNICSLINNLNMIFVILYGGILVFSGALSSSYFYSFCSYSNKFNNSIAGFSSFNMDIQQILVSVERVLDLIDTITNANEIERKKENINQTCYEVSLENVELNFGDKNLFDDVSLKLKKGQIMVLSGSNGVGKTSLLKLVANIYIPSRGSIYYEYKDIRDFSFNSVVSNVTFIFQTPDIYQLSVMENLKMGNNADESKVIDMCRYFGLHKDILDLPSGYDTIIDEKIALSSGQEKKIQVIRGLLADTPILLLDEPLTCLDNSAQGLLEKYIEEYRNNKITIIISHIPFVCKSLRTARIDNKTLFLN